METIQLRRDSAIALPRQLYMQLHHQIVHGTISYRERLPATRVLAQELKLARGVIVECYEMLKTDGLVAGFGKGGTQVCYHREVTSSKHGLAISTPTGLSRRGKMISAAAQYSTAYRPAVPRPLTPGVADFSLFPYAKWQRLGKESMQSAPAWYQRTCGVPLLKQSLQNYLAQYRGIHIADPSRLLITSGIQSAMSVLMQLLADPDDSVIIDQPGWSGAKAAVIQAGLKPEFASVDDQGTRPPIPQRNKGCKTPKIMITTPAIQFPTGRPMSMARREELLHFCAENNVWLIEDDYAAEYSYGQHPTPSVLAQGLENQTVHVGTMSKLLLPGFRLGWMIVPEHIAADTNNALNTLGVQPPYMLQQQLGRFIQYGYLSAHLAHTRAVYNERHRLSSGYLQIHKPKWLAVMPSISGMNLYLRIGKKSFDAKELRDRFLQAELGCEIYQQVREGKKEHFILVGIANLSEHEIPQQLGKFLEVIAANAQSSS